MLDRGGVSAPLSGDVGALGRPEFGAASSAATFEPTVCGLRDRLLREAKTERQRCLEVAEAAERRRVNAWGIGLDANQVDATALVAEAASSSASRRPPALSSALEATSPVSRVSDSLAATSPLPRAGASPRAFSNMEATGRSGSLAPAARERKDDEAQMEAIRTLHRLGEKSTQSSGSEARVSDMSRHLDTERRERKKAEAAAASERERREATQKQVLCLEGELDRKEHALQVVHRELDQREAELHEALLRLRALQDGYGGFPMNENANERRLRSQLIEAEHQLELKDRHISRLLDALRTRGVLYEEESTACGSEGSIAYTVSTATSRAASIQRGREARA